MRASHTEGSGPCPQCGSDDCFTTTGVEDVQGLELRVTCRYCNPCPYQERWVKVNGKEVFHDVADGNTMRIVEET